MSNPYANLDAEIDAEVEKIIATVQIRKVDAEIDAEVARIVATVPVTRVLRGYGGRPTLAPHFEMLTANQRAAIRHVVARAKNRDAEIRRQTRKYGVAEKTIRRVVGE